MVVYGFGAMLGGQIPGIINDKFGGGRAVSKASIVLHLIIYGSLFLCNEVHTFNFLCFFSGFWIGAADSSQMTQIAMIISNHFKHSAQVYAILNIIKTMLMGATIFIGAKIVTKEDFRIYFAFCIVSHVITQTIVLTKFNFDKKANGDGAGGLLDQRQGPSDELEGYELQKLQGIARK
jgi:MFS family permease